MRTGLHGFQSVYLPTALRQTDESRRQAGIILQSAGFARHGIQTRAGASKVFGSVIWLETKQNIQRQISYYSGSLKETASCFIRKRKSISATGFFRILQIG